MLSFHVKLVQTRQTDKQTDGPTMVRQYASDLSMRGHKQEGHDGPGVAHLSLLTKHNQFPTSCEIYVLPNKKF